MTAYTARPRGESLRYLLDTDWAISYLNQHLGTVRHLDTLRPEGVAISIVSLAELFEGTTGSYDPERNERALTDFLRPFPVINLDFPICRIFGAERSRLRAMGTLIPDMDLLIGATALRHGLTMLSNNRRHFGRLPGLNIVSV